MDAGIADAINRRDARLIAEFLDELDTRLTGDRKPWYLGPMGWAFVEDERSGSTNSYRAWLIGKYAWRIPGIAFDGAPADADWDNLFSHLRSEILNRRDRKHASVCAAEIPVREGVVSR